MTPRAPIIELTGITKRYGATVANDDVTFSVASGSVHALLGENGAGKSTTMKILSGLVAPDEGELRVSGELTRLSTPKKAHEAGIRTAFQELTLIPDLTVLENMLIPRGAVTAFGTLKRRDMARTVSAHLEELGLKIDIHALASELSLSDRQKIEIARALLRQPRVILLDEPTSSLTGQDVDWLGQRIAAAKGDGVTVLFISHRMPEVRAFCDEMTILRNGKTVGSGKVQDFSDEEVVEMIIGRSVETAFPPRVDEAARDWPAPVLSVHNLGAGSKLRNVEFDLHPGQILGIAGLQGMGQKDLFMTLFGAEPLVEGEIRVDGVPITLNSPADAIDESVAIGLVPEERKTQGLFLKLSGSENAALPVLPLFRKGALLDADAEGSAAASAFSAVEVDERAHYLAAGAFSGGNQQKIAIAKWFVTQSRILLLFDPTRGIDVGTKHQLYQLIRDFAEAGGAVLFYSTEIPEIVHLSDQVGVIYEGEIRAWLEGSDITETGIMDVALGGSSTQLAKVPGTAAAQ